MSEENFTTVLVNESGEHCYIITAEHVAALLQDMGYRGKVQRSERGFRVETAASGFSLSVFFYNEETLEEGVGFRSYMIYLAVTAGPGADIPRIAEACNSLNDEFRYAKLVLDRNGRSPYVSLQIDFRVTGSDVGAHFTEDFEFFLFTMNKVNDRILSTRAFHGSDRGDKHNAAIRNLFVAGGDAAEAVRLYREAADDGYAGSQNNLGDQYESGGVVTANTIYAAYWYTRAAERGEPTAYLSLSTLLSSTSEDPEVLVDAAKFAILAIDQLPGERNRTVARKCLDGLTEQLSEQDLDRARTLARSWAPLFQETHLMSDKPEVADHLPDGPRQVH